MIYDVIYARLCFTIYDKFTENSSFINKNTVDLIKKNTKTLMYVPIKIQQGDYEELQ